MQDNGSITPEPSSLDTTKKQRPANSLKNLRPFTKNDPRINRRGRPKTFDQFRALAQKIAGQVIEDKDGNAITIAELILRNWVESKEPALQRAFVEYAFGKVPDKLETNPLGDRKTLILHYGHEFKRLENGSDTTS